MKKFLTSFATILILTLAIFVSSAGAAEVTEATETALRTAISAGGIVTFATALDGQTITLETASETKQSIFVPKRYWSSWTPPQGEWQTWHQLECNFGKSALIVNSITIDASNLPKGITIKWDDTKGNARVIAARGDITLKNVKITGGNVSADFLAPITNPFSPYDPAVPGMTTYRTDHAKMNEEYALFWPEEARLYTLGRGGGILAFGNLTLENCTISGNSAKGDGGSSELRGAMGGGVAVYGNSTTIRNSVIGDNKLTGFGGEGGGLRVVTGARIENSSISNNSMEVYMGYGGGAFSEATWATFEFYNSTIAQNIVSHDNLPVPPSPRFLRGGGIYSSGGYVNLYNCTITGNEVKFSLTGLDAQGRQRGGGVCGTIGTAHAIEAMTLSGNIIVGNKVNGTPHDVFSGSVADFFTQGYNIIGVVDMTQTLMPSTWHSNRRHWPKTGDVELGVGVTTFTGYLGNTTFTDNTNKIVRFILPGASAQDKIPANHTYSPYSASVRNNGKTIDDALTQLGLKADNSIAPLSRDVQFYDTAIMWRDATYNDAFRARWLPFWNSLEAKFGTLKDSDAMWKSLVTGGIADGWEWAQTVTRLPNDMLGRARPNGTAGDIGAIEFNSEMDKWITLNISNIVLKLNDTATITANVNGEAGWTFSWIKEDVSNIVTVTPNNNTATITGNAAGTAKVNVTAVKDTSTLNAVVSVRVFKPATSLSVNNLSVNPGTTTKVTVATTPADATTELIWKSDNTFVAYASTFTGNSANIVATGKAGDMVAMRAVDKLSGQTTNFTVTIASPVKPDPDPNPTPTPTPVPTPTPTPTPAPDAPVTPEIVEKLKPTAPPVSESGKVVVTIPTAVLTEMINSNPDLKKFINEGAAVTVEAFVLERNDAVHYKLQKDAARLTAVVFTLDSGTMTPVVAALKPETSEWIPSGEKIERVDISIPVAEAQKAMNSAEKIVLILKFEAGSDSVLLWSGVNTLAKGWAKRVGGVIELEVSNKSGGFTFDHLKGTLFEIVSESGMKSIAVQRINDAVFSLEDLKSVALRVEDTKWWDYRDALNLETRPLTESKIQKVIDSVNAGSTPPPTPPAPPAPPTPTGGSGGGGCNAAYLPFALLFALVPFVLRKR